MPAHVEPKVVRQPVHLTDWAGSDPMRLSCAPVSLPPEGFGDLAFHVATAEPNVIQQSGVEFGKRSALATPLIAALQHLCGKP